MTLVLGAMADKDVDGIIAALAREPSLASARVIATARRCPARAAGSRRSPSAGVPSCPVALRSAIAAPDAALERALARPRHGGPVVVAGSLYLVGEVRSRLVDDPALRDG